MKITTMTIAVFIVSIVEIIRTSQKIKKDEIGIKTAILWIFLWLIIGITSLFPHMIDYFMRLAQMESRMFFIVIVAIMILFAIVFNLSHKLDKSNRDIARLIEDNAILRYNLQHKDQNDSDNT